MLGAGWGRVHALPQHSHLLPGQGVACGAVSLGRGRGMQVGAPVGELGPVSTPGRVPLGVSEASPKA